MRQKHSPLVSLRLLSVAKAGDNQPASAVCRARERPFCEWRGGPDRQLAAVERLDFCFACRCDKNVLHSCRCSCCPSQKLVTISRHPQFVGRGSALSVTMGRPNCRRSRTLQHFGSAGLVSSISAGRVVELHRDWALIERAEDRSRRVYDRRRPDAANVTALDVLAARYLSVTLN